MEGKKHDKEKIRTELLYKDLVNELEEVAKVLTFGAKKYDARNWMNLENGFERYLAALFRHVNARSKGEITDPESGLSHLSHAACCLLFMMYLDKQGDYNVRHYNMLCSDEELAVNFGKSRSIKETSPNEIVKPKNILDNNGIHYGDETSKFWDND